MRRPWFPRVGWGQASNSIPPHEFGDDTEGWYFQIAWLGMLLAIDVGSVGRHERMIRRWTSEATAAVACVCQAYPTHCANDCPTHGLEDDPAMVECACGAEVDTSTFGECHACGRTVSA